MVAANCLCLCFGTRELDSFMHIAHALWKIHLVKQSSSFVTKGRDWMELKWFVMGDLISYERFLFALKTCVAHTYPTVSGASPH